MGTFTYAIWLTTCVCLLKPGERQYGGDIKGEHCATTQARKQLVVVAKDCVSTGPLHREEEVKFEGERVRLLVRLGAARNLRRPRGPSE